MAPGGETESALLQEVRARKGTQSAPEPEQDGFHLFAGVRVNPQKVARALQDHRDREEAEKPEVDPVTAMPVPSRKPDFGIDPPPYRKQVFAGAREQEWKDWARTIHLDKELSGAEKKSFLDIFAAEGGMAKNPESSAYAGVMQGTLDGLNKLGYLKNKNFSKTKDMNMQDIKSVYKAYFDSVFGAVAAKHSIENPSDQVSGSKMLDKIGDVEMASAVADIIFRDSPSATTVPMVQRAAKLALGVSEEQQIDGVPGTRTFKDLKDIASDANKKRKFLNELSNLRNKQWPSEKERSEYYRYKN